MVVNKPTGDNARKGAVKKRSRLKGKRSPRGLTGQEIRRVHGREDEREEV